MWTFSKFPLSAIITPYALLGCLANNGVTGKEVEFIRWNGTGSAWPLKG